MDKKWQAKHIEETVVRILMVLAALVVVGVVLSTTPPQVLTICQR